MKKRFGKAFQYGQHYVFTVILLSIGAVASALPPGEYITFASDRGDLPGGDEIWMICPDGTGVTRVTYHSTSSVWMEPTFSPDGEWIVFEAYQAGVSQLWKVRTNGSGLSRLSDGSSNDRQPVWQPNGDRIVYQSMRSGDVAWHLWTMDSNGGNTLQLTNSIYEDTDASWSPDGSHIVYSSDYGSLLYSNIYTIPAGGGAPTRVTYNDTGYDGAVSWSPDGQWIAFESGDPDAATEIWRIAAPGTTPPTPPPGATTRADGAVLVYSPTGTNSAQNPAFSPDSTTLVFTMWHSGYNDAPAGLFMVPVSGGSASTLLDEPPSDASSVNMPGGAWILVAATATAVPSSTPTVAAGGVNTPGTEARHGVLVYPHPARDEVYFAWNETNAETTTIDIYNTAGDRVAVLHTDTLFARKLVWKVRPHSQGIYYYRVRMKQNGTESTTAKGKIAIWDK